MRNRSISFGVKTNPYLPIYTPSLGILPRLVKNKSGQGSVYPTWLEIDSKQLLDLRDHSITLNNPLAVPLMFWLPRYWTVFILDLANDFFQ